MEAPDVPPETWGESSGSDTVVGFVYVVGMVFSSLTVHDFIQQLASPEPTPGGGTAAAIAGAMGTGLLAMVAGLPRTRANTDEERAILQPLRERLLAIGTRLEACADRDSVAFDTVMAAYRLPKATDAEKAARKAAIAAAMKGATEAPLETLRLGVEALEMGESVARHGNPSAASDARVGAGLLLASAEGAAANVRINLDSLADDGFRQHASVETDRLMARARACGDAMASALGVNRGGG